MRVIVPADKRFHRAHVPPTRKRTWRQSWPVVARLTVAVALAGWGVYWGAAQVLAARALTVNRIVVTGNERMSRGEVLALLEGLRGVSLVTEDLDGWRDRIRASPWVADVTLRRVFPGTVEVAIAERQPLGIGRVRDSLYLLDHGGVIIDEFGPNYAELDLPIIDGLSAASAPGTGRLDESRTALAGRLLADLRRRPDLARRVSQIDVTDVHDAVLVLEQDTALLHLGADRFVERIQSYLDLVPALRERVPAIDSVDLRFGERVYVRPHGRNSGS